MAPPNKAFGQNSYPTRPVKFLVPYPSGGTNDVLARIVGDKLQAKWGQPVIIENRSGGSGNIGAAAAAQADPDGYTLLVSATPALATNQSLYKELSYKPEEFVPITNFGSVPNLVIVRKGLPVNSHDHRSEEHTSELQSPVHLVCRLLLEKKKKKQNNNYQKYIN